MEGGSEESRAGNVNSNSAREGGLPSIRGWGWGKHMLDLIFSPEKGDLVVGI